MLQAISIKSNTELSEILLSKEFDLSNRVNLLFGSNGVGKSTLINALLQLQYTGQMIPKLTEKESPIIYSYIDSLQNANIIGKNPNLSFNQQNTTDIMIRKFNASELSEGQSIVYTIQEFLYCLRIGIKRKEKILAVIDEVDSGMSVDNIAWLCTEIKELIQLDDNIQFIIAFNNYEFNRLSFIRTGDNSTEVSTLSFKTFHWSS